LQRWFLRLGSSQPSQTVPSEMLFSVNEARRKASGPSLVYCGDDKKGEAVAAELIRDVGFDSVGAGALEIARYTEPLPLLMGAPGV
jgi:predicted dinucleotide-binding enzyme